MHPCRFDALAISLSGPSDLKAYSQANTDEVGKGEASVSVISNAKNVLPVCNDDAIKVCPGDISDDGDDPSAGKGDYAHSGEDEKGNVSDIKCDAKKDSDDRVGDDKVHGNNDKGHVSDDKCGGSEESDDEESEACDDEIDLNDGKGFNDAHEEHDAVKESNVEEDEADDNEVDTDDDNSNVSDSKCDSSKKSCGEDGGNEVHANDDEGNAIKETYDEVNEAHNDEIDISDGKGSVIGDIVEEEADGDDANEDKGNVEGSDKSDAGDDKEGASESDASDFTNDYDISEKTNGTDSYQESVSPHYYTDVYYLICFSLLHKHDAQI